MDEKIVSIFMRKVHNV